jgi:polyphosphate kinase 2
MFILQTPFSSGGWVFGTKHPQQAASRFRGIDDTPPGHLRKRFAGVIYGSVQPLRTGVKLRFEIQKSSARYAAAEQGVKMKHKHADGNGHSDKKSRKEAGGTITNAGNHNQQTSPAKAMRIGEDCRYGKELKRLHIELAKLQEWIRHEGMRVVVLFEGRDAAGKGGAIKRISEPLNPRICRVVALATPTEREKTQWYFQRYAAHLPAAGEMVLFDRSWYNRAGVERVMGFCTDAQYQEFMQSCPEFERMLIRSGIKLIKYWFSVSDEEQERRFQERMNDVTKRWKLSPMDLESRKRWADYSHAKDDMFAVTDTKQCPWYVVHSDNKEAARLNVIRHLLSQFDYKDLTPKPVPLPPIGKSKYVRPPIQEQNFIPEIYR